MNILLPTDFSQNANKATEIAFRLAKQSNGQVTILHAYDLPYSDRSMTTSLLEVMKENAEGNMAEFETKIKAQYGDKYAVQVRLGNPIRLIHEVSDQDDIDMVVMGTKGASGIEEILIGSNAASVIQNTNKPVMVIPPNAELGTIQKIVFASDLDPKVKSQPLDRLREFAKVNNAEIDIVHVQGEQAPVDGSRDFYSKHMEGVKHGYTILRDENVEKAITDEAQKEGADIIAAITRRYGFFEGLFHRSMTNRLAYHSSLPLLVLHEPK